jgi:hypothetical protein
MDSRDRMVVGFITTYAISATITTNIVNTNLVQAFSRGVLDTTLCDKVCQ